MSLSEIQFNVINKIEIVPSERAHYRIYLGGQKSFIQPMMRPESSGPTMILALPAKRSSSSPENLAAMLGRTMVRGLDRQPGRNGKI